MSRDAREYSRLIASSARKQCRQKLSPRPIHALNFVIFLAEPLLRSRPTSMAEPPESSLPAQVLEKLRELNTELAEGECVELSWK